MKLHILGIAGTFMGGVAALARELGHEVEGSDQNIYPPMSTQLERLGIALKPGYEAANISADCDEIVVGNALSRGNEAVEHVLDAGLRYTSGAQWLSERLLPGRDVLAVAGTHGKTTTTTILSYLLERAGRAPGFLIGGVAEDFGVSARIGGGREFVVEADEYDTAFFDKRSKFVHYRPLVAILNNLEYDHADIFPDVAAIQRQFHHLVRTVPRRGRLLVNGHDRHLREVLAMGCWTPVERFGFDPSFEWSARKLRDDGSAFVVLHAGQELGTVEWPMLGDHNVLNGLAALAACSAVGVDVASVIPSLAGFSSVKRRSNSMRLGAHAQALAPSLDIADVVVFLARPELPWDADQVIAAIRGDARAVADADALVARLREIARDGDHVVFMSNGGFDGAPRRFLAALRDA